MHQNLIERDDIPEDPKLAAGCPNSDRITKAGLLDRAEETFERLRGTMLDEEAKRTCSRSPAGKDWERRSPSPECRTSHPARKLPALLRAGGAEMIPLTTRDEAVALDGPEMNRHCVRASLLLGDLNAQEGDQQAAIDSWQQIEIAESGYLALVAQRPAGGVSPRWTGATTACACCAATWASLARPARRRLPARARAMVPGGLALVRDELRRNPTLLGFDKLLLEARLFNPPRRKSGRISDPPKGIVQNYTRRLARLYRCDNCGFKARQFTGAVRPVAAGNLSAEAYRRIRPHTLMKQAKPDKPGVLPDLRCTSPGRR